MGGDGEEARLGRSMGVVVCGSQRGNHAAEEDKGRR